MTDFMIKRKFILMAGLGCLAFEGSVLGLEEIDVFTESVVFPYKIPQTQDNGVTFNRAVAGFMRTVNEDTGEINWGPVSMLGQEATRTFQPPPPDIYSVPITQVIATDTFTLNSPDRRTYKFRYEFGWAIYEVPSPSDIKYVWTSWVGSHPEGIGPNRTGGFNPADIPPKPGPLTDSKRSSNCATGDAGSPEGVKVAGLQSDNKNSVMGSPQFAINPVSGNMTARDAPIWWQSPYGLDVTFTLNFNSLDTVNAIRPFGPGWVLNYCAYAFEDASGAVTIVAGDGDRYVFAPDGSGGYTAPLNLPCTLVKTGSDTFEATYLPTDTVYTYGRPSGVSTAVSLFLSAEDRWGVSVTMGHNSNGALTSVTHSIGGTWDLVYNTAGLLERIDDPFGRSAYFAYDAAGALREVTDMGGLNYAFRYSTSANPVNATPASQMFLTEVVYAPEELATANQPNRTWYPLTFRFLTEPPDGNPFGTYLSFGITTSQVGGGTEKVSYNGNGTGSYRSAAQVAAGSAGTTYNYAPANGYNHVAAVTYPDGGTSAAASFNTAGTPLSLTARDGVALTQTVNSFQQPLTVTDPASRVTTLEYESNGLDLKKVTGPDSVVATQITYNSERQPATITHRDGTQVVMTYNSHGQPLTATLKDAAAATVQTTTYTYNSGDRVASVDVDGRTIASYTYDSVGRVVTVTDEDSITLTYTHDDLNRVTKVTYPDSTFEEVAYHPITGMKAWSQGRDGGRTLYFYDQRGYLIAANEPGQRFTFWNYNDDGQLILLIDPKGNRTTWEYDIEGRLVKKTLQDSAVEQLAWNTKSQVTQHTSPRGMKSIFTYDTLGRLTSTAYQTSSGSTAFPTESVTYDVLDRVATSVDGEGTTTYAFDSTTARLTSVDGPYGSDTVSYGYDDLGRIDEITTPGSITQSFTFDSDERLSAWTDVFGSGSITYSGRTSRATNISRAGGLLSTSFAYTAASDLFKLAQIKHETGSTTISQFDYTWNARQDIATWTRKLGSTADRETRWELGHDAAHQLISATLKQVSNSAVIADQRWGFDSIGNRTLEHDLTTGVRTEYSHNSTNQLVDKKTYSSGQKPWVKGSLDEPGSVSVGGKALAVKGDNSFEGQSPTRTTTIAAKDTAGNTTTESWQLKSGSGSTPDATHSYTHDNEGNLLGDGTSTFEWDLRNRLTAIVTGTHRTEFTYDGSDRRVRVVEKESGTVTSDKRYVFNGLSLLEERADDNSTVLRRFYDGGHVDVADSGKRYAYTTDHLGSIREVMLLDGTSGNPTTATLAARYDYDLWGKRSALDGGSAAETLVLHGYTGHVYHQWSGLWLAPYRAYSSGMGRWTSRDLLGEAGGVNLYAYCLNNPGNYSDSLGLEVDVFTGSKDFLWMVNRDFVYRAYYNWKSGGAGDEAGYLETMNEAQDYVQEHSPFSSVYTFAGIETGGHGPSAEALFIGGFDASGSTFASGLIGGGAGGFTYGKDFEFGEHPTNHDIALFEPGHRGTGVWATDGGEGGAYVSASVGPFFFGVGAGIHLDRFGNLFSGDFWHGRLAMPSSKPEPATPNRHPKDTCKK